MKDEKNKVTGLSLGALLFIIVLGFGLLIGLTQAADSQNLNLDANATNNPYYNFYFNDSGSLLYYAGQEVDVAIPTTYTLADRFETRKLEFINFYDINTFAQRADIKDFKVKNISEEVSYPWGGSYYLEKWQMEFRVKPAIVGADIVTTNIASNSFANNQYIQNVTMPQTVTQIGDYAFANSTLNNISLSSNLQSIGSQAFQQTRLTSFEMPNSVTYAGFGLFQHCFELTNVVLSQNLTEIPSSMFWFCENLQSITIPNSVNYIGSQAFYYCYNLTSITIPESVQAIGNNAFMECYGLQYIVLERLTPPNINGSIINTAIIVYVPYNSLTQYQNSSWSMYDLRPVSELTT